MTLFGYRLITDAISYVVGVILEKGGLLIQHKEESHVKTGAEVKSYAATSQGTPRITSKPA